MCLYTLYTHKYAVIHYSYTVFTHSDIYISINTSTIEVPLGAQLSLVVSFSTPESRTEYMFYPLYHTPLQQATLTFTILESSTDVHLSYNRASPSLTGTYVACQSLFPEGPTPSVSSMPAQCGRKISLNVTSKHITVFVNFWLTVSIWNCM